MSTHVFSVGELVILNRQPGNLLPLDNSYTVKAQMPPVGVELQYRIKGLVEPYERVVTEHQLTKLSLGLDVGL